MKDRNYALKPKIAAAIAQASSHEGALAQGSPASPCLSNLVAQILDFRLAALAARAGCVYSRYADDLTFSTNKSTFPQEIAKMDGISHDWVAGSLLVDAIQASGFEINPHKTRMQYRRSRQEVTGLVVNKRVNIKREYRHTVRAMVDRVLKTGSFEHFVKTTSASGNTTIFKTAGTLEQLQGMLGFIDSIDAQFKIAPTPKPEKGGKQVFSAHTLFLFFTNFYACSRATIVGEGKTDNIYLTHAIRSNAALFPRLGAISSGGRVHMLVRLLKYTGRSTGKKMGLMGGAGDLKNLIRDYKEVMTAIKAPGLTHPIIILVDNDGAGNDVKAAAVGANANKTPIAASDTFYWIYGNLYITWTPLTGGAKSSNIEDSFTAATRGITLAGRTFNPELKKSDPTQYGKADFAYKVIEANATKTDFSGFKEILERLSAIIEHYDKKLATDAAPTLPSTVKS